MNNKHHFHTIDPQNVPSTSKEYISEGSGISESSKEKEKSQRSEDLKSEEHDHNENYIPEKVKENRENKSPNDVGGKISTLSIVLKQLIAED